MSTTDELRPRDLPEARIIEEAESLRQDYPEEAVGILEDFVEGNPVSLRGRLHLAALYANDYGLGIAGAERLYREILQDYPDCAPAMWSLGLLQGHPHSGITKEESLELLEKAASMTGDPDVVRNLATKAWEVGETDQALKAFGWLKVVAPESRKPYFTTIADDAVARILAGERLSRPVYTWPEAGVGYS